MRQKHLQAARPTEDASETPAGRQADGKFTLSSRFALFFIFPDFFLIYGTRAADHMLAHALGHS